ncbi:hypothetical protein [Plantactinospora sp. KBS50]|uniref:hypothetical protein n=1 Tax=Plantactinospora sp. KBS50 TaxID=2024580 RepID=UPI001E4099D9|nr:hypothetical protein [Plantactinospora sp. KBS50]
MTGAPRRMLGRLVGTPFGRAVLACLALAGWALWSAGVLDGPVARQVRSSSVYAAPGVDLDVPAAQRVIGNRRLVVLMMAPDADLRDACHRVDRAASGTLVLAMSRAEDDWDTYGCAKFAGGGAKNFGRAVVAESTIARGADNFVDRPLEALKVVVLNYDLLVRAGTVPDGARTVSPSLPRYLLAAGAVAGVVTGAVLLWLGGRRAARLTDQRRVRRAAYADERATLGAATAVLAQQIIDLDRSHLWRDGAKGRRAFQRLAGDYTALLDRVTELDPADPAALRRLGERVERLSRRAHELAGTAAGTGAAGTDTAGAGTDPAAGTGDGGDRRVRTGR